MENKKIEYSTIALSKELKKEVTLLKTIHDKESFEDLLKEMIAVYIDYKRK